MLNIKDLRGQEHAQWGACVVSGCCLGLHILQLLGQAGLRRFGGFALRKLLVTGLFLCSSLIQAQTAVSGSIGVSSQWTSGAGPYVVSGSLTIDNGAILTIDPGVTVYMTAGSEIRIRSGKLLGNGSAANPIQILSDKVRQGALPAPGDWEQLVFEAGASGSALSNARVSHGKGLVASASALALNNVNLTNHAGPAIAADLRASLSGSGNQASGNLFNAVVIPAGEIAGSARFALRGLPYLLQSGTVSVGVAPRIDSVSPSVILAGDTATLTIAGSRLAGASSPVWSVPGLDTQILPGATDSQVVLRVVAALAATAGNADLVLQTDAGEAKMTPALIVQRNQPRLNAISPNVVLTGVGPTTLTFAGDFIAPLSVVELDGQALESIVDSPFSARALLPSQTAAGTRSARLRTPDTAAPGASLLSNALPLVLRQPEVLFDPAAVSMVAGSAQAVVLRLPFAAPSGGLEFVLTSSAPGMASTPASVAVAAGAVTASFSVQGVNVGAAQIVASRNGWTSPVLTVAVIVPPVTLAYSPVTSALVGIQVGSPTSTQTAVQNVDPLVSASVGISVGSFASATLPQVGVIGTRVALQISGIGLSQVSALAFSPPDGLTVGIPSVSTDGQQLNVDVDVDVNAPKSPRRIVLRTANGFIPFSNQAAAGFLVTAPPPELISVSPQIVIAGQAATVLTLRGLNLRDISGLRFEPPQGIATAGSITVNPEGTLLQVAVQSPADAVSGPRTVVVVAAGGESSAVATPANVLQVARQVSNFADLNSPLVGVIVGSAPVQTVTLGPVLSDAVGVMVGTVTAAAAQVDPLVSPIVGLIVGSGAFDMTPKAGVVGTGVNVTVVGAGLGAVSTVRVLPGDGVVAGAVTVNPAGTELSFSLAIDAGAPKSMRRIVLQGTDPAQPVVPFLNDSRAQFLVTVPPPEFISIEPQVVLTGLSSMTFTVRGRNLRDLSAVRFEPAQGLVQVTPPTVNAEGTLMQVLVQTLAGATSGPRTVIAVAAGGESSAVRVPANTIYVAQQLGSTFSDASSLPVGVMVGTATVATQVIDAYAAAVGVAVGPVTTGMTPAGAGKGASGSLLLSGAGLGAVSGVALQPAAPAGNVTFGVPSPSGDGSTVEVPYSVAANAVSANYRVVMSSVSGTASIAIPALDASRQIWRVLDLPTMVSFEPLVMQQGRPYTLVIRGTNLKEVSAIAIDPATGITIDRETMVWSSDSFGEKLSVRLLLAPGTETGAHVLRLIYPGGSTSAQGATNNTFSVTPP